MPPARHHSPAATRHESRQHPVSEAREETSDSPRPEFPLTHPLTTASTPHAAYEIYRDWPPFPAPFGRISSGSGRRE